MVAGHLQTKKGYYYMVLNLKSEDGNRKSKWISTGIPATGKKSAKLEEEMLAETRCTYKDAASPCAVSPVISREDISFSDYMIKWLGIIKNSVEVDTYAGYVNNIEKRIVPYFRGQRILLRELTALDVENFYSYCFNELHLKGTTVQRFHANIHKAMKYARKHDLIASNPMDNVERPKSQRYVGAFYSVSELETLFQAVKGDPCEFPVLMAAFYGLRRSEIMGLRWRAIDFENNLITIDHTVVQCMCDGTTITVEKDRTKNQSSCRSMPLVPQYRDLLLRMKVRQECCRKLCGNCYTESEYIFVNDMGEPYQPNYVTQHFKLVLRKNHLRNIRFHDLRHTCASLLLDMSLTEQSVRNLKVYMDYRGFFSSQATYEVDTTSRKKRAFITYRTVQREPYRINRLSYDFRDRFLEQIILPDTVHSLLRTGEVFDMEVLDQERQRITTYLKQRGYYNFTVNNIEYEADTLGGNHLVDLKMIVKQHLAGYNEQGYPILRNNTVYRIDQINIFPNYDPTAAIAPDYRKGLDTIYYRGLNVVYHKDNKRPNIRPSVLRQIVPIYPNYVYNINRVDQTYNQIMSMGYFKSANVIFNEQADSVAKDNYVTFVGEGKEPADSVHQTREGYLQCDIQCIPALKQGYKIELEGSTTSSFYGLRATVGYQNRNIFRGAESFDVSFSVGYEYMKTPSARKRNAIEFGVNMGLQFPRFLLPFRTQRWQSIQMPRTRLEFGINFQDRPYYRRTLSSVAWGYSWSDLKYSSYSLRPIDINVIDMGYVNREDFLDHLQNEYLKRSYESQFISGLSFSYVYNNQRKHLGGNATLLRFNYEMAGNLLDGLMHLFSRPAAGKDYYEVFGLQYSQYFRADLSVSRKIMLGEVTALVGRLYGGYGMAYGNSTSIPFDRLFYAGGANSMRGWAPRMLGPGAVPEPEDAVFPTQLGDMKLEANLELRFPIWGMFHGATFVDVGNIWFADRHSAPSPAAVFHFDSFYRQLGFDAGIGLRLDIKFAVLRLDWGIQIHNPNAPAGQRWIHNFKWKNTALNFGVGYPF